MNSLILFCVSKLSNDQIVLRNIVGLFILQLSFRQMISNEGLGNALLL